MNLINFPLGEGWAGKGVCVLVKSAYDCDCTLSNVKPGFAQSSCIASLELSLTILSVFLERIGHPPFDKFWFAFL